MKKDILKILLYSAIYFLAVFFVNAVFIRPGIGKLYGADASNLVYSEAFIGVFIPLSLILPSFQLLFWQDDKISISKRLIHLGTYVFLVLVVLLLYLTPQFEITDILFSTLIIACFSFMTLALDYLISATKISRYWRSLIIVCIIFTMLTSILWINPILESNSNDSESFNILVDIAVAMNPAVVIIENVFNINLFRSGNFYSHSGGVGLSIIGDYLGSVSYFRPLILYPIIYVGIGLLSSLPLLIFRKFRTKKNSHKKNPCT